MKPNKCRINHREYQIIINLLVWTKVQTMPFWCLQNILVFIIEGVLVTQVILIGDKGYLENQPMKRSYWWFSSGTSFLYKSKTLVVAFHCFLFFSQILIKSCSFSIFFFINKKMRKVDQYSSKPTTLISLLCLIVVCLTTTALASPQFHTRKLNWKSVIIQALLTFIYLWLQ